MDKLVLCSKIFYDRDIIDKNNEIFELKEKFLKPTIVCGSLKDWEIKLNLMFASLRLGLTQWIILEEEEYERTLFTGSLSGFIQIELFWAIVNGLDKLIEKKKHPWSLKTATCVMEGIESSIISLSEIHKLHQFTKGELVRYIYGIILLRLNKNGILLSKIATFICKNCKKYHHNLTTISDLCYPCRQKLPK